MMATRCGDMRSASQPSAAPENMPATADKMAKMSDAEARELLEASNIDWTELGPDLETVLAAIAQDGVAQGLAQIGYR